jgi:hypothetical protein
MAMADKQDIQEQVQRRYGSEKHWRAATGMTRTRTFQAIKSGDLKSVRIGRQRLIDFDAGFAWLASFSDEAAPK